MKKSLRNNLFLTFILSLALFGTTLSAQEECNLKTELLVYILPDSLELPQMEIGLVSIESIGKSIGSKQLHSALISTNVIKIGRAFPQWATKDSVVVRSDGEKINAPAFHRIFIVTFESEGAAENAISVLSKLPSVKFAERHSEPVLDNDPSYLDGAQWYLANDGRLGGVVGADINVEDAWGIFTGSSVVKIAIIDSGIDLAHDEFIGRVTGDAQNGHYHGTLVAGVAAANAMNEEGIRGVDWNAQIISKRVFNSNGSWRGDNTAAQKITDAIAEGANVLNCSWSFSNTLSTTLKMAFDHAYQMDRVVVATMGNTSVTEKRFPSGYRNVIAVGATQNNDERSPFSTMGTHIDFVAPGGVNSDNTNARNIYTTTIGGGYTFVNGTSFAAPQVAGLASLLKGFNSNLTNDDIRQIIRLTADDRGTPGFDPEFGYGRINAGNALSFINEPNEVVHGISNGGSTTKTNLQQWVFTGSDWMLGLAAGTYYDVDRYKVTKRVVFDAPFCSPPTIWLRERQSACLNAANPNDGIPWVQITNLTETGFNVTYYVYYVRKNSANQTINKWVPANITQSKVAYTAIGEINIAGTTGPIIGSSIVCSSNTTFTLNSLPENCNVSWSKSSNLSYINGQNTTNYTVTAANSTTNGAGWVKATISNGNCDPVTITKELYVGTPPPSENSLQGPIDGNGNTGPACLGQEYLFKVEPTTQGVIAYKWRIITPTSSSWWEILSSSNTQMYCTDVFSSHTMGVRQKMDGCSWSQETQLRFPVIDCQTGNTCGGSGGGPRLLIAPNPTSVEITISEIEPTNENIPWVLRLMSQQGAVMVNVTTTLPQTLSVQGLQPGVYVLHARRGSYSEQQVVVVE